MAETEEVKATCPVCANEVGTKEDGTKIKVHKVAGERCDGSDAEVQSADDAPAGLAKGESYEALDGAQGSDDETDVQNDGDAENGAQTDAQGSEFVHTVVVHNSCPYLDDSAWHAENQKMAAQVAQEAGHTLAGGEAAHVESEPVGDQIHVRYSVPVK